MKPAEPPESMRSKIVAKDLAQLPKPLRRSPAEHQAAAQVKLEKELHNQFSAWLRMHDRVFQFNDSAMNKRSTMVEGWPDYTVLYKPEASDKPLVCLIELKIEPIRFKESQRRKFSELMAAGITVNICTTLKDATDCLLEYFGIDRTAIITNEG